MKYHALVVDDSPDVLDEVKDRLDSMGHSYHCATDLEAARDQLVTSSFSYVLLDLEIPVRYGRKSRIANGQNLLREIRMTKGYKDVPIIVMTSHGHDSPDLAIEVLRCDGATDFVKKTFAENGHTLETAIRDALAASGRSRPGANHLSKVSKTQPVQKFECGEMVFSEDRVELCEVKICGGPECGMIRRILDELRWTNSHGRYVRYSGNDLAKKVGCEPGENGVAGAVRDFRNQVCRVMLAEANIQMDRLQDIILNDRRYGYRLSPKITIRDADDVVNQPKNGDGEADEPQTARRDAVNEPQNRDRDVINDVVTDSDDVVINERQRWALGQMQTAAEFRKTDIVGQFKCSNTTAERDLRDLRQRGLIEFIGPRRTGYWQLAVTPRRASSRQRGKYAVLGRGTL